MRCQRVLSPGLLQSERFRPRQTSLSTSLQHQLPHHRLSSRATSLPTYPKISPRPLRNLKTVGAPPELYLPRPEAQLCPRILDHHFLLVTSQSPSDYSTPPLPIFDVSNTTLNNTLHFAAAPKASITRGCCCFEPGSKPSKRHPVSK